MSQGTQSRCEARDIVDEDEENLEEEEESDIEEVEGGEESVQKSGVSSS